MIYSKYGYNINISRKEEPWNMNAINQTNTALTKEDEEKIKQAIEAEKERIRQDFLEAEMRNRMLDEQRKQPGYAGY